MRIVCCDDDVRIGEQLKEYLQLYFKKISTPFPEYSFFASGEELLKDAFKVAKELGCVKINIGIVEENKVLKKWYESFGFVHTGTQKFDFFPFTCGYMEKNL